MLNNCFGYYTNMLYSQAMMPNLMMQNMLMGGGMPFYSFPTSIFPQSYSFMPMNYSFMPQFGMSYAQGGGYLPNVTSYFDFLNNRPQIEEENVTGHGDVNVDVNGKKLAPFAAFEKMEDVASDLGYEKSKTHNEEKHGVLMVDEEWRAMAREGHSDTEKRYMELVKKFGKDFIKGIDKKHGNGNGKLTYAEFEKYQMEDVPQDADKETKKAMKESAKIAFDRLNLNGGRTIDQKEITAFLAAMDYDKVSNVNGRITVDDFTRWSVQLADEEKNDLDKLLKDRYEAFFDKKV